MRHLPLLTLLLSFSHDSEQWVARDVGTVKTDYTELESYTR